MTNTPGALLRNTAATLMCLSGLGQIAALWLRELSGPAVTDGLAGTVYLVIGIGLFGRSRFSLFMAILVPIAASAALVYTRTLAGQHDTLRIAVDTAVVLLSASVLWQVRHHPSE
jgi:hypothetical protein